jgi:alpha-1,2-mannosyltransferase
LLSICVVAVGSLLASPVSWSHHWVWAIPVLGTLTIWAAPAELVAGPGAVAAARPVARWRWWVLGAATVIIAAGPMQFLPKDDLRELDHTLGQQIVADTYAGLALAYLGWAFVRSRRAPVTPDTPVPVSSGP